MNITSRKLIAFVGTNTIKDFKNLKLRQVVQDFCEKQEQENPNVKKAEIKGTQLHRSHDDPKDLEPVISIRFRDENNKRLGTGHVHEDGTGKVNWK